MQEVLKGRKLTKHKKDWYAHYNYRPGKKKKKNTGIDRTGKINNGGGRGGPFSFKTKNGKAQPSQSKRFRR